MAEMRAVLLSGGCFQSIGKSGVPALCSDCMSVLGILVGLGTVVFRV